jgi:hypothetical protein
MPHFSLGMISPSGNAGQVDSDTMSWAASAFTDATSSWVVPAGVTSICVACIGAGAPGTTSIGGGGGALAYTNNVPVTPGETLTVHARRGRTPTTAVTGDFDTWIARGATKLVLAKGALNQTGGTATASIGTVKFKGGNGATYGGGGAAGFASDGGAGSSGTASSGWGISTGGGGNGGRGSSLGFGNGGGGNNGRVQAAGHASDNGTGSPPVSPHNASGSFGSGSTTVGGDGGDFGGGGGRGGTPGDGTDGFLYIIWGEGRSFPSNSAPV